MRRYLERRSLTARQLDTTFRAMSDDELKRWEAQQRPWFAIARMIVTEFQPKLPRAVEVVRAPAFAIAGE